jgi:hypothetical protein
MSLFFFFNFNIRNSSCGKKIELGVLDGTAIEIIEFWFE